TGDAPGPQWSWQARPDPAWWALPAPGRLRLACRPDAAVDDLRRLPNVLAQRLPAPAFTATTGVTLTGGVPGARAGLTVLGDSYAWIGLEQTGDGVALVHRVASREDDRERDAAPPVPLPPGTEVRLRARVTEGARVAFLADTGDGWRRLGGTFTATPGRWVGASLGIFAAAPGDARPTGRADFGAFRVTGGEPPP
ncbi:hypothetical protein ACSNOI_40620, partial [Actinomadura kijaniata]|uniref:beta-xylosidase family glycoside hydrolase n=1 Tax=Actinomadura kijaniata TaxID=46161 RepID=UPI003F1BCBF5